MVISIYRDIILYGSSGRLGACRSSVCNVCMRSDKYRDVTAKVESWPETNEDGRNR